MKKIKLAMFFSAAVFAGLSFAAASDAPKSAVRPAYDLLLAQFPTDFQVPIPAPVLRVRPDFSKPPCTVSQALTPGTAFVPHVSDERRIRAINDLLAKIAVCTPLPYTNDGIIHSDIHATLPTKPAGFYKEYTLIIPGRKTGDGPEPVKIGDQTFMTGEVLSPRGPERLMIGGNTEVYYTPDHYKTFVRLTIAR